MGQNFFLSEKTPKKACVFGQCIFEKKRKIVSPVRDSDPSTHDAAPLRLLSTTPSSYFKHLTVDCQWFPTEIFEKIFGRTVNRARTENSHFLLRK